MNDDMAKQKAKTRIKKSGNGRAKPLVAKATLTRDKSRRYNCGGKLKKADK